MLTLYRLVMDPDVNPIRALPSAQRLQVMIYLSVMWTTLFCTAAGAWVWFGELIVAHALVAFGLVMTGLVFQWARGRTSGDVVRIWRLHR